MMEKVVAATATSLGTRRRGASRFRRFWGKGGRGEGGMPLPEGGRQRNVLLVFRRL